MFDRDASTTYAKDELPSILAAAGKDGIFPNEAAEHLALKSYYYERDVPDRQDLFHHLYEIPLNRVHSMCIAANEALIDLAVRGNHRRSS